MKKIRFITVISVVAVLTAACTKEIDTTQEQSVSQITATWAENRIKTVLGENGTSILWSPYDEISVFYNGDGVKFTSINSVPKDRTIFRSEYSLIYGGTETSGEPYFYAVYPYSSDNAQEGEILTLTVPATQTAVEGSFAPGAFPSVGRSKNTDIAFYNVCGGISFSVTTSAVKKVVFSSLEGKTLAGEVNINFDEDGKPVATAGESAATELTLLSDDGLVPGASYYISAVPATLSEGFKMVFYTAKKHATLTSSSAVEIKRSVFGSIRDADAGLVYEDGGADPVSHTRVITAALNNGSGTKTSLAADMNCMWDDEQQVFLFDTDSIALPDIEKQTDYVGTLTTDAMRNDLVLGGIPCGCFSTEGVSAICSIPTVQDGSFNSAYIAMAKTGLENQLDFAPASAIIKLQINGGADSIRFTTPNSVIAGDCSIDWTGTPALTSPSANASSSILIVPEPGSSVCYIGTLPFTDTLKLLIYKDGGVAEKKSAKPMTVTAGHLLSMAVITPFYAVDLGLSVKWATCNIGATKPEEYGTYFAWGDVTGQTWSGSEWSGGGFSTYPAYELDEDNNLKPEYDAAHVNLGGTWRIPTKAEQQELLANCTSTWTSDYNGTGVAGRLFTSNKEGYTDKSIFLPAAGYGYHSFLYSVGSYGGYWSGSFHDGINAWYRYFRSGDVGTDYCERYYGFSVRPVTE